MKIEKYILWTFLLIAMMSFKGNAQSQDIRPVLGASVYQANTAGKTVFRSNGKSGGQYENVEILIIDSQPVLRWELGEADEYGFVKEDKMLSRMYVLSGLESTFDGNSCTWKGWCARKRFSSQTELFMLELRDSDRMIVVIGNETLYCHEIKNYDILLLDKYSKIVEIPTQQDRPDNSQSKKKSTPKKSTKPPLKK